MQRWCIEVDASASQSAADEPLVLAMFMQQRVLEVVEELSLQLPPNPLTTAPPPPISSSGDAEPLPHLPAAAPTPRIFSVNNTDLQVCAVT
jgi:hypothetical protein